MNHKPTRPFRHCYFANSKLYFESELVPHMIRFSFMRENDSNKHRAEFVYIMWKKSFADSKTHVKLGVN